MQRLIEYGRKAAFGIRHNSRRVGHLSARFNRGLAYAWDLLVWSRVEAARAGMISLELPAAMLERKQVHTPPPHLLQVPEHATHFQEGYAAVHALLFANLQSPDILSCHRYAHPGPAFRGVYLWDSAFIAQIWKHWDSAAAAEILQAVIALRDGDRLQHVVADFVQSAYTQPPLIAWSLARIPDLDPSLLKTLYPALKAYNGWLHRERQLPNHLFAWRHPYESGIDNAPRFSNRDESRFRETRTLGAPDFSSYVVLQLEALSELARRLGRAGEAEEYVAEAEQIRAAIQRELWHEADGLYYDRDIETGEFVRSRTIASLLPLWAGVPDARMAERLLTTIMDPGKFGGLMPLPSVALDDEAFSRDMWRGPVWMNVAYGVLLGMRRYGFDQEAGQLAWRLCDGVFRVFEAERQIYEFYDPTAHSTKALDRKKGNRWKALTLGTGPQREFVGWSGLVNSMIVEFLFGWDVQRPDAPPRPMFPPEAAGCWRLELPSGRKLEVNTASPANPDSSTRAESPVPR